ncbi:hypothetical protein MBLNU459_g4784t3 [Dothideomycetes sp. NU459]
MPPKGSRVIRDDNDSRSDGSSSKQAANNATGTRGKRQGAAAQNGSSNLKDAVSANDVSSAQASSSNGFTWHQEDLSLLQNYRAAHRIDTPSSFTSSRNQYLLTNPNGIGRQSPTMARKKDKRKVSKEQLALAVRKNFNDAAVNEIDVMVDLLYKVRNQDKPFRMRSVPPKNK